MKHKLKASFLIIMALCLCLTPLFGAVAANGSDIQRVTQSSGEDAKYYKNPSGKAGETVNVWITLTSLSGALTNVSCQLDGGNLPEQIELVSGQNIAKMKAGGETAATLGVGEEVKFTLPVKIKSDAKAGTAELMFKVAYTPEGGADAAEALVPIPLTIADSKPVDIEPPEDDSGGDEVDYGITYDSGGSSGGGGSSFKSKPKVVVSGYTFDVPKLYAGESFKLNLKLRNTSDREAVKNLQVNFANEAGVVMPVSGGSNSIFIGDLPKESGVSMNIGLQIVPDAEPKAQMLNLEITYEGTKNKQDFTEKTTIAIPVVQKTRVRTDEPVFYDEAWAGQSVNMSVQMFNMGKSSLYNCMVEIQGEGLSLEETYYAGNIASGGTMRADLTVLTKVVGDIEGAVRITYEDVYGDQSEEILPFVLTVNDEASMATMNFGTYGNAMGFATGGNAAMAGMEPVAAALGVAWYWWALALAAVIVLAIILLAARKRRRTRMLQDRMLDEDDYGADYGALDDGQNATLDKGADSDSTPDDRAEG